MSEGRRSIDAALIRYRIERRMAGRRDLLLHLLVYVGVAALFRLNVTWLETQVYFFLGGLWTIPLVLHGLRYYYRCGPGMAARADEIERALDEQGERTALDEDEELLIEERVSKRVTARRVLAAHGLSSLMYLVVYLPYAFHELRFWPEDVPGFLTAIFSAFGLVFALHAARFFFVHGRTPVGRALKIDAEIERTWGRARREPYEEEQESATVDLGEIKGRRLRLTAEGELAGFALEGEATERRAGRGSAR